jgi:hypothetical protein
MSMAHDPWTDPDPRPGDFAADLSMIDPRYVEAHVGNRNAKLTLLSSSKTPRSCTDSPRSGTSTPPR